MRKIDDDGVTPDLPQGDGATSGVDSGGVPPAAAPPMAVAWGLSVLAAAGSLGASPRLTGIAKPVGCEVWWIAADGAVIGAWAQPGDGWSTYVLAPPGSAATDGGITAISKGEDLMEVWWVAPDGSVQAAYHEGGWNLYTLAGAGSASVAAGITAIAKGGDLMEVWWVAPDGSVQAAYHDGGWNLYALTGAAEAAATSGITAVSKGADLMEVWWVAPDGSVQGAFHEPTWQRYALTGPGMASLGCRPSSWFGSMRSGISVRLWWIDPRGVVWEAAYDGAWTNSVIGGGGANPSGAVLGFAFNSETMGVCWGGTDGSLIEAFPPAVTHVARVSGGRALRGVIGLTLRSDGSSEWWGDVTNDAFYGYNFGVSAFLRNSGLRVDLAGAHRGRVAGYAEPGSSDDLWSVEHPSHPALAGALATYRFGSLGVRLEHSVDLVDYLKSAVDAIFQAAVGTVLVEVGAVIVIGAEIVTAVFTDSPVVGAILAGGVPWLTGPAGIFVRVFIEGVHDDGRLLTQAEYDWANDQVFAGALPPIDSLRITPYRGVGDAPFTWPTFAGPTLINVGEAAYADIHVAEATIIHELVHACQIARSTDLIFTTTAIVTKIADPSGDSSYAYGQAGFDFTSIGFEAQAQVVEDWFLGRPAIPQTPDPRNHSGHARDPESPYYRYLTDNVRTGRY